MVSLSVVIRTKEEAPRLKLALASYQNQASVDEIVVVDDGSSDETAEVLAHAAAHMPLQVIRHERSRGRSVAANAGAQAAASDVLLFMDGDVLAAPDLLAKHKSLHSGGEAVAGRGEHRHLRGTRFLHDPDQGTPRPDEAGRVAAMSHAELARNRVTRDEVLGDFAGIDRRAQLGLYPGASARRLCELELEALQTTPDLDALWAAASGHNFSVGRESFLGAGGFDADIALNAHRELAYRLCRRGIRLRPVTGARSYHLTHRSGWRDPMEQLNWETRFYARHQDPAIKLLVVFWASISEQARHIPPDLRITSLAELDAAAKTRPLTDFEAVRDRILRLGQGELGPTG